MSSLTRGEVTRIADLARLALTDEEVDLFTKQLGDILGYVEQIQGLDTAGVAPTAHVLNRSTERPDEPAATLARAGALDNAPDAAPEAGLFKVPRVL